MDFAYTGGSWFAQSLAGGFCFWIRVSGLVCFWYLCESSASFSSLFPRNWNPPWRILYFFFLTLVRLRLWSGFCCGRGSFFGFDALLSSGLAHGGYRRKHYRTAICFHFFFTLFLFCLCLNCRGGSRVRDTLLFFFFCFFVAWNNGSLDLPYCFFFFGPSGVFFVFVLMPRCREKWVGYFLGCIFSRFCWGLSKAGLCVWVLGWLMLYEVYGVWCGDGTYCS